MNSLKKAIDVPLMDVNNISNIIASYCCNYIYSVSAIHVRRRGGYYMYEGEVCAESKEECFNMIKNFIIDEDDEGVSINDVDIDLKSSEPCFSNPEIIKFNTYNEGGLI